MRNVRHLALLSLLILSSCSKRDGASSSRSSAEPPPPPQAAVTASPQAKEPEQAPGNSPNASMGGGGDTERVIATLRPRFRACYQTALATDPNAEGSVSLVAHVAADGHVSDVSAPEKTTLSPALVTCLSDVVRSASFPAPGGSGSDLRVPVSFNNAAHNAR